LRFAVFVRELSDLERVYKKTRNFLSKELSESSYVVNKLPESVIVEVTVHNGREVVSKLRSLFKRLTSQFSSILKTHSTKRQLRIFIVSDMTFEEQIAYIIREAVRSVIDYKVIDSALRDAILYYLCYKFSSHSENLISRRVVELFEKKLNQCKEKNMVVNLDSIKFSERIVINPPPEKRSILDEFFLPFLEILDLKYAGVRELERTLRVKDMTRKMFEELATGRMKILFIGRKRPEEYVM